MPENGLGCSLGGKYCRCGLAGLVADWMKVLISYRMPALRAHGVLVYYAAFKGHIGLYPPVSGDARLLKAVAPYAGPKGNLRFPYDKPIPYDLIASITRLRARQDAAKALSP